MSYLRPGGGGRMNLAYPGGGTFLIVGKVPAKALR